MDKNLINIDDLVRQRLGGGEEREQAGSWDRMRDLLDKEMPKRPAGMYWRRSLSAVALLLLVAGLSVGGYEMAHFTKAINTVPGDVAAASATRDGDNRATNSNTESKGNKDNSKLPAASGNDGSNSKVAPSTRTIDVKVTNANNQAELRSPHKTSKQAGNAHPIAATKGVAGDQSADDKQAVAGNSEHGVVKKGPVKAGIAGKQGASTNVKSTADETGSSNADDKSLVKNDNAGVNGPAAKEAADSKTGLKDERKVALADKNKRNKTGKNNLAGNTQTKTVTMDALGVGSKAPGGTKFTAPVAATVVKDDNSKGTGRGNTAMTKHSKPANKNINTPAQTGIATTNADNAVATDSNPADGINTGTTSKHSKAVASQNEQVKTYASTTQGGKPAGKAAHTQTKQTKAMTATNKKNADNTRTDIDDNNTKQPLVKSTRKGQRLVERLVLSQHLVKTSAANSLMHLDTVSMETVTEEYDVAMKDANAVPFGPETYDVFVATTTENSFAVAKEKAHVKKSAGASSLENLNAAFNDMKNKVKGAHFGAGLTAGINSTFFGPNSFKGFQFGVTGNFAFSENVSLMAEMKYVHRINNDYTLKDNYYTYTPVPTGGYTRELVVNPYSFSTLHSIEMPISLRYCIGNFNFFTGGNLVYTFAINTGAYPLADPSTATAVAAMGNDNKPKINNQDFDSRFGFGYLFGASYQVSPNVMVDLRSVQTIWDNSNSEGSKIISGQLYKSPSLQLSVGYRLGGRKTTERE